MSAHSWRCELRVCAFSARVFHGSRRFHSPGGPERWERAPDPRQRTQVQHTHSLFIGFMQLFFTFRESSLCGHMWNITFVLIFAEKYIPFPRSQYLSHTAVFFLVLFKNRYDSDLFAHLARHQETVAAITVTTDLKRSTFWCFHWAKLPALHFPWAPLFALFTSGSVLILLILHFRMLTTISVLRENLLILLSCLFCISIAVVCRCVSQFCYFHCC